MPALRAYGRAFHIASDDVPLFALGGAIFHLFWIVAIAITARNIIDIPDICRGHAGLYYIATVASLLACFATGFILEILLMWQGCQGCIFEPSKRRRLETLVTLRFGNIICEILASAFGTYVLAATDVECRVKELEKEVVLFNPKKEVLVLVIITWVFQILTLLNILILYNAWPDQKGQETWEQRFLWLGRYVCCQCGQQQAEDEQRRRSLRRIAKWVTRLLGTADLTPSDSAVALVLVATLQRQARKERIARALEVGGRAAQEGASPAQAISLLERAGTIQALPVSTARGSINLTRAGTHSPIRDVTQEVLIDIDGCYDVSGSSPPGTAKLGESRQPSEALPQSAAPSQDAGASAELKAGQEVKQYTQGDEGGHSREPSGTGASQSLQGEGGVGQNPLDKFVRQMALIREATITPSGMDEQLRDGMPQDQAVQLYTGSHWRVEAATLADVEHFTKFAMGVYGYGGSNASSIWGVFARSLIPRGRKEQRKQQRDILNKAEVNSLYERLFYENVLTELGESSEIIYLSVANAALAHLPYLVALDHQSRSVVIALRGTTSVEDIITDSVAEPEKLDGEWVPKGIRDEAGGPLYAHAGIKAAADAVLKDLDEHRILKALIEGNYGDCDKSAAEEVQKKDEGASKQTKQEHYVAALMQRKLDCRNWRLVLTGHSLGAGAAALIALHLSGRFPNLHCWALSPPGGLMSTNLSRAVQRFVTSVIVGKDVVPRVSVVNLGRLIDQMVTSLALCKVNKSEMILRRLSQHFRHERAQELFWQNDEVPQEALDILKKYSVAIEARSRMLELVPPGRVIFLRPLKTHGARAGWDAVWVKAEEVICEGILISPRMAEDHSCMTLLEALRAAQQHPRQAGYASTPFQAGGYIPPPVPQGADISDSAQQGQPGDDLV